MSSRFAGRSLVLGVAVLLLAGCAPAAGDRQQLAARYAVAVNRFNTRLATVEGRESTDCGQASTPATCRQALGDERQIDLDFDGDVRSIPFTALYRTQVGRLLDADRKVEQVLESAIQGSDLQAINANYMAYRQAADQTTAESLALRRDLGLPGAPSPTAAPS